MGISANIQNCKKKIKKKKPYFALYLHCINIRKICSASENEILNYDGFVHDTVTLSLMFVHASDPTPTHEQT